MKRVGKPALVADPRELEVAYQHYLDYFTHKIPELRAFLNQLGSDNITEKAINGWLTENGVADCGLKTLLLQEIKVIANPEAPNILLRCRRLISHRYRVQLIEQYKHLIQATFCTKLNKEEYEKYEQEITNIIRMGLWINGRRMLLTELAGLSDQQEALSVAFNEIGLNNQVLINFLNVHIGRCCEKGSKYFSDMTDDLSLLLGNDVVRSISTHVEYNTHNETVVLYFVQTYRDLYRLNSDRVPEKYTGDHTQDNTAPIIAQTTISFFIKNNDRDQCKIELHDGFLVFNDPVYEGILLERLSARCSNNIVLDESKKPLLCNIPDLNDQVIVDRFVDDCLALSDLSEMKRKLIEANSALKIFLVARKNESIMWEVLHTYELLLCLCKDTRHKQYLELLKSWYCLNPLLMAEISFLLDRIDMVKNSKLNESESFSIIKGYLCKEHRYKLRFLKDDNEFRSTCGNLIFVKKYKKNDEVSLEFSLFVNFGDDPSKFVTKVIPRNLIESNNVNLDEPLDDEKIKLLLPCILQLAAQEGYIRIDNPCYIIAALHAQPVSQVPGLDRLVADDEIRGRLSLQWILDLARESWELASWLVKSKTILSPEVRSLELCKLLRHQPMLWKEIQSFPDSAISLMLRDRINPQDFCFLLFENKKRESLRCVKDALCKDPELFEKLCTLKESHPNELLTYFYRTSLDYRLAWEKQYLLCESYLLSHCDDSVVEGYYRNVFRKLDKDCFSSLFENLYIKNNLLNGSERSMAIAKKVWITSLEERCIKNWDLSLLYDSQEKMAHIIRCLYEEPRFFCLFKIDQMMQEFLNTELRDNLHGFIRFHIENYHRFECGNMDWLISALKMLDVNELKTFFRESKNCLFYVNVLVKNLDAIDVLISNFAVESEAVLNIIIRIYPQLLLLLLVTLCSNEQAIRDQIQRYGQILQSISSEKNSESFKGTFDKIEYLKKKLDYIHNLKEIMIQNINLIVMLLSADDFSEIDVACLLYLVPGFEDRFREIALDEKCQSKLSAAQDILKSVDFFSTMGTVHSDGVNIEAINDSIVRFSSQGQNQKMIDLLNYVLLNAFKNNDFASMIISTPSLMSILVHEADLFLLSKFACLYGKLNEFSAMWLPFFHRLASESELYRSFESLLHFHFRGTGGNRKQLIKVSSGRGFIDHKEYIRLLLTEYSHGKVAWYREWLLRSECLSSMVTEIAPEDLALVLIEEIRHRKASSSKAASAIESCLRKEPVLTSILSHSGSAYLVNLLQMDSRLVARIIEVCRATIMRSRDSSLRELVISQANFEQLIYLIGDGHDHPEAVRSCMAALRNIFTVDQDRVHINVSPLLLIHLLQISERIDPDKTIGSEWGRLVAHRQSVCEFFIAKRAPQFLVIKSVPVLWRYFHESRQFIQQSLNRYKITYEDLKIYDIDSVINFVLSNYCMIHYYCEINKKFIAKKEEYRTLSNNHVARCEALADIDEIAVKSLQRMKKEFEVKKDGLLREIKKLSNKLKIFTRVICRLFLESNEQQLKKVSIRLYVSLFIQNIDKYILDYKSKVSIVIPRLTAVLISLAEHDQAFVLNELMSNRFLLSLIETSPSGLCILVSSSLFKQSEDLQRLICNPRNRSAADIENTPLRERQQRSDSFASAGSQVSALVASREGSGLHLRQQEEKRSLQDEGHSSHHSTEKSF